MHAYENYVEYPSKISFFYIWSNKFNMYKRRDWLMTHGADGGGDETSSSSSESSKGAFYICFAGI